MAASMILHRMGAITLQHKRSSSRSKRQSQAFNPVSLLLDFTSKRRLALEKCSGCISIPGMQIEQLSVLWLSSRCVLGSVKVFASLGHGGRGHNKAW